MKLRAIRRDHLVLAISAGLFALLLITVNMLWPDAFGVFIAIGGVVGALVVVYEVSLTKRLAQAEFIRDLQTGFASDANIGELWRKLLLNEEITAGDRHLVSSYLTFFETLQLLLNRGTLDLRLTDDLFRNRFFTAVGNHGVLRTALVKEAGAFANIHHLVEVWHDYLLANDIPIHAGYYAYVQAVSEAKGYSIGPLGEQHLPDLLSLQNDVIRTLKNDAWLRANTDVMLKDCLVNHSAMGAWYDGALVAAAVLYDGGDGAESIKHYVTDSPEELRESINLKLVMALPSHRKLGVSRTLVELLEQRATQSGKSEIMCTIHPDNAPSRSLFHLLGYAKVGAVATPYGRRLIYGRHLPLRDRRWAR